MLIFFFFFLQTFLLFHSHDLEAGDRQTDVQRLQAGMGPLHYLCGFPSPSGGVLIIFIFVRSLLLICLD